MSDHDEIAKAAFLIYEHHGSEHGHDVRNWLDAETHVHSRRSVSKRAHREAERSNARSSHAM